MAYMTQYVGEFIGCWMPRISKLRKIVSTRFTIFVGYSRIVFVVLLLLMTLPRPIIDNESVIKKPLIAVDAVSVVVVFLFGFSNGFANTFLFTKYLEKISGSNEKKKATQIMTLLF